MTASMTNASQIEWRGDDQLWVGGTEFRVVPVGRSRSTPHRFLLLKNRQLVDAYINLAESLKPRRIVELGIFEGGSTALLELLFQPDRLVAFELSTERVPALDRFLKLRRAEDRVRPYYGISQASGDAMAPILRENFGSSLLDLVIDDASHELDLTRQSFNILFPLLRPGGLYIIEDWGWGHVPFSRVRRGPSLAKLVLHLVLTMPYAKDLIDEIIVNGHWAMVRRGHVPISMPFDVADQI
ncbi:MAG: class I SAM-dependent methyltransferase, partial [Acidimicrobiales bacterium]